MLQPVLRATSWQTPLIHCTQPAGEWGTEERHKHGHFNRHRNIFKSLKRNILPNTPLDFSCLCLTFRAIDPNPDIFRILTISYWSRLSWSDFVTDLVLNFSHDVQIWQTWFHHQHISSFSHVSLLQQRTTTGSPTAVPASQTHKHTHARARINLPRLEWRVLLLREAADSNVCPQMQVWTVQHLCM